MKYIFIILPIIIIVVIIVIVIVVRYSSKTATTSKPANSIWSGSCSGKLKTQCINNNCGVFCDNNLVKTFNCSSMANSCNGTDCDVTCEPPTQYPVCTSGVGVYQGTCKSVPEISSLNNQFTISCGGKPLPIPSDRLKCKSLDITYRKGLYTICCTPLTVPTPPSCGINTTKVWEGDNCGFREQNCKDGKCSLSCNGKEVFAGSCGSMNTTCLSNGTDEKCIACCSPLINSPPVCGGNKTKIWSGSKCNVMTSSCFNGECNSSSNSFDSSSGKTNTCLNGGCKATCDGVDIEVPKTCFKNISSTCNSSGCVVCCDNAI